MRYSEHSFPPKKKKSSQSSTNNGNFNCLASYGNPESDLQVSEDIVHDARQYLVSLYGHTGFDSLDVLRRNAFATNRGDVRSIPPTEDAFYQHLLHAFYQLAICKRAHVKDLDMPSPTVDVLAVELTMIPCCQS